MLESDHHDTLLHRIGNRFSTDLAIDLGSATVRVWSQQAGLVCCEPSVVARDRASGRIVATGSAALAMQGRTHAEIEAVRAVRAGAVADAEAAEALLRDVVTRARRGLRFRRPRVVVAIGSETTQVEKRALREVVFAAGAREVFMIQKSVAAPMGARAATEPPSGHFVVDIGAGTTEICLMSEGGAVFRRTLRLGGDTLDRALSGWLKRKHDLVVGETTAERLKLQLGGAEPADDPAFVDVPGFDRVAGAPRTVRVSADDVREAMADAVESIVAGVRSALEDAPPEIVADLAMHGVVLSGGSAHLPGLAARIERAISLSVRLASDPVTTVVTGASRCYDGFAFMRAYALEASRPMLQLDAGCA